MDMPETTPPISPEQLASILNDPEIGQDMKNSVARAMERKHQMVMAVCFDNLSLNFHGDQVRVLYELLHSGIKPTDIILNNFDTEGVKRLRIK